MKVTIIINIITSIFVFAAGLLIAFGVLVPNIASSTQIIFGILFMAYGIYRFVNVQSKIKLMKMQERSERMKEETEELIKNANK